MLQSSHRYSPPASVLTFRCVLFICAIVDPHSTSLTIWPTVSSTCTLLLQYALCDNRHNCRLHLRHGCRRCYHLGCGSFPSVCYRGPRVRRHLLRGGAGLLRGLYLHHSADLPSHAWSKLFRCLAGGKSATDHDEFLLRQHCYALSD